MIKNIIFDLGKVLVSYEPNNIFKYLNFNDETIFEVNKAMFKNDFWKEFDRSKLNDNYILDKFISNNPKYKNEISLAFHNIDKSIDTFDYTYEWVSSFKNKGYNLYVLSNYAKTTFEKTREKLNFLNLFDGIVFSFDCKFVKPEFEIYYELIKRYNLTPNECVFIDDKSENISSAKNIGMEGIIFNSYEQANEEISLILK